MEESHDSSEVMEYYDMIAPSYEELYGEEQLSKYVGVEKICNGARILDVGCGTGLLLKYLLNVGARPSLYVCLDISRKMLERCGSCENRVNAERIASDMTMVNNLFNKRFECITLFTVLLTRYDIKRLITEFSRVIIPGGRIVYSVLGDGASCPVGREVRRLGRMEVLCVVEYTV